MNPTSLLFLALALVVPSGAPAVDMEEALTAPGVSYDTYFVRWWGAPGSQRGRPFYRMARFDTGTLQVHYGIVPGRDLDNFVMPYASIRSFLSFVDAPAELAQQVSMTYHDDSGEHTIGFTPRSGVELAAQGRALLVKLRNRSLATPEDMPLARGGSSRETNPLALEQVLALSQNSANVPVQCTLTNVGDADLSGVTVAFTFEQSFCWTHFGAAQETAYEGLAAQATGAARAFYAWSDGMARGYAIATGEGTELHYELDAEMNRWQAQLRCPAGALKAGEKRVFRFEVRKLRSVPKRSGRAAWGWDVPESAFVRRQPGSFRTAPVAAENRVTLADVVEDLDRPKVRGMNLYTSFPQLLEDLDTLKAWGCNLMITGLGDPDQTAEVIEHGHGLGMEMLIAGHGSHMDGAPVFDAYYASPRTPVQLPDGHGQDEDHNYWYATAPTRSFEADAGKPMAQAMHNEMVTYWARCFSDKWRGVQDAVAEHAPNSGIWFYAPCPGVAHVEPIDGYDSFLRTMTSELGQRFTVFPFYYGVEYNQIEYMMSRWKKAGAARVVFLPMREFLTLPSQYIRAATAARRGGADGVCGFSFSVSEMSRRKQWMWKAVMLGGWANFPTPELGAYCLLEEPAELVEALAQPGVALNVVSEAGNLDTRLCLNTLLEILPHARPESVASEGSCIEVHLTDCLDQRGYGHFPPALRTRGKGVLQMSGKVIRLSAADETGLEDAWELLLRFAQLGRDEYQCLSRQ